MVGFGLQDGFEATTIASGHYERKEYCPLHDLLALKQCLSHIPIGHAGERRNYSYWHQTTVNCDADGRIAG